MRHVATKCLDLGTPVPVAALHGSDIVEYGAHHIRLLTWVDGIPLTDRRQLDRECLVELGAVAARMAGALADFEHPQLDRVNQWDPRRADEVVRVLLRQIHGLAGDQIHRHDVGGEANVTLIEQAVAPFGYLGERQGELPMQPVHCDVTDFNTVCRPGSEGNSAPVGVLDFGDVMRTWRVGDVAASAHAGAAHGGSRDALGAVLAVLAGYQAECPLAAAEAEVLWPLVLSRGAVCLTASLLQAQLSPGNEFIRRSMDIDATALQSLLAVPASLATAACRVTCGKPARPANRRAAEWLSAARPASVIGAARAHFVPVDLSVTSDAFAHGEWDAPAALGSAVAAAGMVPASGTDPRSATARLPGAAPRSGTAARPQLGAVPGVPVGRWGECRITDSGMPAPHEPANLHLGADIFATAGTPVRTPVSGRLAVLAPDEVVLDLRSAGCELFLRLAGVTPDAGLRVDMPLTAGAAVGVVSPRQMLPPHTHVQLLAAPDLPHCGTPGLRDAWLAVCPDPSPLLGIDAAAPPPASVAERKGARESVVARPQRLFYRQPVEIVRGWRHFLYDADGRPYLDMINNIASVGHSHPRIAAAAWQQLRRLNTNSRFLYDSMTRYCARIAQLLPGLDSVFLVNSGSEAADLALQLARTFTRRHDVVVLAGAYHGWTGSVLDLCTAPLDRPGWRDDLAPYIHVVPQPDPYRGLLGADGPGYAGSVRAACVAAAEHGRGVAAFIAEPMLGNQGAVEPAPGFFEAAYQVVRDAGGLCIADEVQVGLGRTGHTCWAFEHEHLSPDIVITAKAAGNGHPLGVVACRPEIADEFDRRSGYFSSTGGGPVSCEIGIAVLDVLRDERLQDNARNVGGALKRSLAELSGRHEIIGAVHGRGLYLGVDLVRDRQTKEPAVQEAMVISEQLRRLGVIMQPTGDAHNVLKVKPPLCLDQRAADYFVAMLDRVLFERGW
jgi:4-aminobutyrate aminotransferase-like enzyme/Ser/Thr protein kinase RdoA (MazF antagonist)